MNRITRWLKFIATGSASLLLSACYGVQQQMDPLTCVSHALSTKSEDGTAIPGIRVSYQYAQEETTEHWTPLGITNDSGAILIELDVFQSDVIYLKFEDMDA